MPEQDPHTRLEQLRFLERVQVADLERTRRWIAQEEKEAAKVARRQASVERATPDWVLQGLINAGTQMVHAGDCWAADGKRVKAISREAALEALARGAEACNVCKPDAVLGLDL